MAKAVIREKKLQSLFKKKKRLKINEIDRTPALYDNVNEPAGQYAR